MTGLTPGEPHPIHCCHVKRLACFTGPSIIVNSQSVPYRNGTSQQLQGSDQIAFITSNACQVLDTDRRK
jgi:hypothetical protein